METTIAEIYNAQTSVGWRKHCSLKFDQELSTVLDKFDDSYLTPLQIIEKLAKILPQEDAQDDDDAYSENDDGDEYEA